MGSNNIYKNVCVNLIWVWLFISCFANSFAIAMEDLEENNQKIRSICVYCSASPNVDETYLEVANKFGKLLAKNNIKLIYGGGQIGMMGHLADGCLEKKGQVHGVIPEHLQISEVGHAGVQTLEVVPNMHLRKAKMFELSDAVVVLPGGYGTLDETLEVLTWKQLSMHNKPIIVLNHEGFWDPLRSLLDHLVEKKFASPKARHLLEFVNDVEDIIPAALQNL
jgi:uncharacterized protein (TIGR00730 family)